MEWYYASGNERKGPVDSERLLELAAIGDVTPETLVWREGFEAWKPYAAVVAELGGAVEAGPTGNVQKCAYSGELRPESEMLRYGEHWVRADCKAAFVASLQAGKEVGGGDLGGGEVTMRWVGFWWRVLAKVIDGILFMIVLVICALPAILMGGAVFTEVFESGGAGGGNPDIVKFIVVLVLGGLLWFALNCFYMTWMVGKYGATVGKMVIGARVVCDHGAKVTYLRAFARFWAEIGHSIVFGMVGGVIGAILTVPFAIASDGSEPGAGILAVQLVSGIVQGGLGYAGYIWAAFHKEKAAVHDLLCGTRVVKKS